MTAFEPGMVFANRFEIERAAGSGGMGDVYRARDRYTGEPVALKLLQPHGASPHAIERFTREARLLSEMRHDGIVAYVAHGRAPDGRDFLAMEWLDGEDLAARLARGPLGLADTVTLLRRVADALAVAHTKGVIHRDLKPANVFLPGGDLASAKLLDFGVARRVAASRAMTAAGLVVGTPDYMAPEQARGDNAVTPSADVFSLGCVLYECLAGHPPFTGDHVAAVLARILFEDPPSIEARRPGVPPSLAALLHRMLAKFPAERLADATELSAALASLGEIPDLPFAPTMMMASAPPPAPFGENEQALMSLVLASLPPDHISSHETVAEGAETAEIDRRRTLASALRLAGVHADFLADGSLVVTVPSTASAIDQAAHAARAALVVKEHWPAADVALCTGRGAVRGRVPVGDVVEQAAQLLGARATSASPNALPARSGVRVDRLTAGLLEPRFALTPSPEGPLLVGEEKDADVTRLLLGKPTPCVGREAELGSLEALLAASIDDSEARAVLVTAPPGTGKSRLRHELLRRVAQREGAVTVLLGRGDSMSAGEPYGILRPAFELLWDLRPGEPIADRRARIEARSGRLLAPADRRRVAELLGEICGVPFPGEGAALLQAAREDPKIMRDQVRRAFTDWLRAACAEAPVLLVLDDLHWGDALTVGLVDHALAELSSAPLFVLALARPEIHDTFPRLWQGRNVQQIALKGLGKKACERLIQKVLGPQAADVVAKIAEQSAGNALFLEELIRAASEGSLAAQPDTVVAMLQARIGRFEAGPRRAIRAASVLGPTFWQGGVAAILGSPPPADLDAWLDALVDAEVIERRPSSRLHGEREHTFRHALVRDAAYALLTADDRATGHRLAGAFLEAAGEPDAIMIADHFERGGDPARAVSFYVRAAEAAMESCAFDAAARCAERGIACGAEGEALGTLRSVEGSIGFWRLQIESSLAAADVALPLLRPGSRAWARLTWATAFAAARGPAEWRARTPALVASFVRTDPDPDARIVYAEGLLWMIFFALFARPDAEVRALVERLDGVTDADAQRTPAAIRWKHLATACVAWQIEPRPWQVIKLSEHAAELAHEAGDLRLFAMMRGAEELTWSQLGDPRGAIERLRPLLKIPQLAQDDLPRWVVLEFAAEILVRCGDDASLDEAERLLIEGRIGAGFVHAWALSTRVRASLRRGKPDEAMAREAFSFVALGPRGAVGTVAPLVRVLLAKGSAVEAAEIAARGLAILRVYRVGYHEVEFRLAASEAFHAAGDLDRARAEIAETLRRIQVRCDDIPDPTWRARYLSDNPDNARAVALAHEWAVPDLTLSPGT